MYGTFIKERGFTVIDAAKHPQHVPPNITGFPTTHVLNNGQIREEVIGGGDDWVCRVLQAMRKQTAPRRGPNGAAPVDW